MAKTAVKKKIVPLNDKILVKRLEAEEKTAGGIVLPDTAKEKPREGIVSALGRGRFVDGNWVDFQVKVKDRVLFSSYAGTEVTLEGVDYLILTEDDVLGIVEG
jgi:chaperonin GroES